MVFHNLLYIKTLNECFAFLCVVLCRIMETLPHVIWWDNFSKLYATSIPNNERKAWADCLWTGVGLHICDGPPVTLDVTYDDAGQVDNIMPLQLDDVSPLFDQEIQELDAEGEYYLDNSLV